MHQDFKDQRLVGGSWRIQAFWVVEGPLVFKHGPSKGKLSGPVDVPAPREVVLLAQASDGKVTGRELQLLDLDASGPRWDGNDWIICVGFMLIEVQAFVKLASRIIPFANTTRIQNCFRAKFMIASHWFTNPIDTNVVFVWGARSSVFHLAGHRKKKFEVLRLAVQFTSICLFHFGIGFPLVEPSTERFAVVLCTLLGSEIQAIFITRVNIAQLIHTARTWTELATILRLGVIAVSLLIPDSATTSS